MRHKFKNEIDMDTAGEITRRMDALEKRVSDQGKEIKLLKENLSKKTAPSTNKPKKK